MCQYSCTDGVPNDWHLVHLGSRAVGGAGLVMVEATAVTSEGRISPADTGLWNDIQENAFKRISSFISSQGSIPGIQLAYQALTDKLALVGTVNWQNWSKFGKPEISVADSNTVTANLNYQDTYHAGIEVYYRVADPWLLMA